MLTFSSCRSVLGCFLVAGALVAGWWLPGSTERAFGTDVVPPNACKVSASGTLSTGDTFSGNADPVDVKQLDGPATGTWTLVTPLGDQFVGTVTFLSCRRDGGGGPAKPGTTSNIAELEGTGTWNGTAGYEFVLTVHDHGRWTCGERDVLQDDFAMTIANATVVAYTGGGLVSDGDIQLLAPTGTPSPPCLATPTTSTPTPTATPTDAPTPGPPVGGIGVDPGDIAPSGASAWPLAEIIAFAALLLSGAAWYARKRWRSSP
jgi:hypothetical protein